MKASEKLTRVLVLTAKMLRESGVPVPAGIDTVEVWRRRLPGRRVKHVFMTKGRPGLEAHARFLEEWVARSLRPRPRKEGT